MAVGMSELVHGNDLREESEPFNLTFDESKFRDVDLSSAKRNMSRFLEPLSGRFRDQRGTHVRKSSSGVEQGNRAFSLHFNVFEASSRLVSLSCDERPLVSHAQFNHARDRPSRIV
jgi:hypothetical protein